MKTHDPRVRVFNHGPGNFRTEVTDDDGKTWEITGPPYPTMAAALAKVDETARTYYGTAEELDARTAREGDRPVATLGPDARLLIDASCCIVLATPERRITVGNVADWRDKLDTAHKFQRAYSDDAEQAATDRLAQWLDSEHEPAVRPGTIADFTGSLLADQQDLRAFDWPLHALCMTCGHAITAEHGSNWEHDPE